MKLISLTAMVVVAGVLAGPANAQQAAARVYSEAYRADPGLYTTLRSLDSIGQVIGRNTSVVLRTDAAPFRVLVDGPAGVGAAKP